MKPTIEKIIKTLEAFKKSFEESEKQYQILNRWQNELRTSHTFRPQKIYEAIKEGYCTMADISEYTGIPYKTVQRIIPILKRQNKIIETSYKNSDRRGAAERLFKIKT